MADPKLPDLLIVGDSHSVAIKAGCDANGLDAALLSFSGNHWHAGNVVLHREHGLWVRGDAMQDRIRAVRARLGGTGVLRPDLPVLASVGFHLGRLVPPFGFRGHVTRKADFNADGESIFASSGLVTAYAEAFRSNHIRFLRRMARHAPVTIVAPPPLYDQPNYAAFCDAISGMIRAAGLTFYDPREDWGDGAPLGQEFLAEDGVHGNADYGRLLVGHMIDRGLITPPAGRTRNG